MTEDADDVLLTLAGHMEWVEGQIKRVTGMRTWLGVDYATATVIRTTADSRPLSCAFTEIEYMATKEARRQRYPMVLAYRMDKHTIALGYGQSCRSTIKDTAVSPGSAWPALSPWRPDFSTHQTKLQKWARDGSAMDRRRLPVKIALALARRVWPELWDA